MPGVRAAVPLETVEVRAATVPTDAPESDGTFAWDRTTIVLAEVRAGGMRGLGWTYADTATARLARELLAPRLAGRGALDVEGAHLELARAVRNLGQPGVAAMAISALDAALWDLKARLLGVPLFRLLGAAREAIAAYGSGGFTSYTVPQLQAQLGGWAEQGFRRVKMKIGRDPAADVPRARAAREAIGPAVELFVDANGAYSRKQALAQAEAFALLGVTWLEEPVSSDDLAGLRLLRDRAPAGMDVAAGECGYTPWYFRRMPRRARWTSCRPTPPAAAGRPASSARQRCATRSSCRSRRTAPRSSTRTSAALPRAPCTSSTSTITPGSSGCSSTVRSRPSAASCGPTPAGRGWASRSSPTARGGSSSSSAARRARRRTRAGGT